MDYVLPTATCKFCSCRELESLLRAQSGRTATHLGRKKSPPQPGGLPSSLIPVDSAKTPREWSLCPAPVIQGLSLLSPGGHRSPPLHGHISSAPPPEMFPLLLNLFLPCLCPIMLIFFHRLPLSRGGEGNEKGKLICSHCVHRMHIFSVRFKRLGV